jgi:transposase InsO family protein
VKNAAPKNGVSQIDRPVLTNLVHHLTPNNGTLITDQASQFTFQSLTGRLEEAGIAISMDGRGRVLDNIFVERLWRTVKYEDIYIKGYATVSEL